MEEFRVIINEGEKRKSVEEFFGLLRFFTSNANKELFLHALQCYAVQKGHGIVEGYSMVFSVKTEKQENYGDDKIQICLTQPAVDRAVITPLTYEEFYPMLCEECEKYLEERPEDRQQVQELLAKIKAALGV